LRGRRRDVRRARHDAGRLRRRWNPPLRGARDRLAGITALDAEGVRRVRTDRGERSRARPRRLELLAGNAAAALNGRRLPKLRLERRDFAKVLRARFTSMLLVLVSRAKSRRPTLTIVLATTTVLAAFVTAARPEQPAHGPGAHGDRDAWAPPG